MPSLVRFLLIVAVLVGVIYGGMVALVTFVQPQPREIIESVPPARLNH